MAGPSSGIAIADRHSKYRRVSCHMKLHFLRDKDICLLSLASATYYIILRLCTIRPSNHLWNEASVEWAKIIGRMMQETRRLGEGGMISRAELTRRRLSRQRRPAV